MRTFIFSLLLMGMVTVLHAQPCSTPAQNLQKYWEYRERLKDFVVVGSDSGCSLMSTNRSSGTMNYNDEPTPLGYYIGVLASEYYLLDTQASDTASENQKQRTLEELYYALAAAQRLDQNAEGYWGAYYLGYSYIVNPSDLNGFMLRDDISSNFLTDWENGDYVDNDLNKGLSPPPNGAPTGPDYRADLLNTSFISGINSRGRDFFGSCIFENAKRGGPNPMSTDELTQLFTGLAIVSKLLPAAGNPSYPIGNNLTIMAQNIATRITNWMNSGAGVFINPITGHCATGMDWNSPPDFLSPCKCVDGGSEPGDLLEGRVAFGIVSAEYAINTGFSSNFIPLNPIWSIFYKNAYVPREEFIPLTLGTIGKSWGSVTGGVVNSKALDNASDTKHGDVDGLPLLFTVLWGENTANYGATYYDNLVSDAPCHGPVGYDGNYEWSTGERWVGGPNKSHNSYSDIFFGVDYMLYFNLLCVAYPTLTATPGNQYTNYFYIPAKKLRYPYLIETNYTESSEKNFAAADSIEAGNIASAGNYTIANNAMYPSPAQVHFMAGQLIDLVPGFDAEQGITLYDAYIDTSIHAMNCSECDPSYNAENSLPSIYLPAADTISWFSTDTIESCTHCDTIRFMGIEGDTMSVTYWHWDFGNGDTSNSSHPYVVYCLSGYFDTATGNRDTAFQVTLIATDSASGENDTLVTYFYIYCPGGIPLHHAISSNREDTPVPGGSSGYSFTLQPSLTNNTTTIQYTLPGQAQVTIRIYTLLGVDISDVVNTVQNAGQYSVNYNTSSLPPGIYYVSMLTGNFTKTLKLIVVK